MKKRLLILISCLILAACERPATISSWSPINDVKTPAPASTTTTAAQLTQTSVRINPSSQAELTPWPTLDLSQFPDPLPDSMKGYELVSWQEDEIWYFTLFTGTNREQNFEELMFPDSRVTDNGYVKITVSGVDQIKKVLGMLPVNTEVFWGGMSLAGQVPEETLYFSYPTLAVINELIDFCEQKGISLQNLSEPE